VLLCTTVVHSDTHTHFVCVFFWFSLDYFVLVSFTFVVLDLVSSVLRQDIGYRKNVSEMIYFVSSGMQNLDSISQSRSY